MTDKYTHKTYGPSQIWDPDKDAWRLPETPAELAAVNAYSECLKNSFVEVDDDLQNKS
jgi:hypothetical protein